MPRISATTVPRHLLLFLLAATVIAVSFIAISANPQPASAKCIGGTAHSGYIPDNMGNFAWEGPNYSGTCDGDDYYSGAVKDVMTDGYCVYVFFRDTGTSTYEGYSCNTSGNTFNYSDRNSDSDGQFCVGKGRWSNWCLESPLNPGAWYETSGY